MRQVDDLITEPMDGGALIYDLSSDQIHSLGGDLWRLWNQVDGYRTTAEIATNLRIDESTAAAYVAELAARGLLELDAPEAGLTRRAFGARAGLAAAGIVGAGLISSIAAPTPAAAASGTDGGGGPEPQCCTLACWEYGEGSITPDFAMFFDLDDDTMPAGFSCSSPAASLCAQQDLSTMLNMENLQTCTVDPDKLHQVVACGQSFDQHC